MASGHGGVVRINRVSKASGNVLPNLKNFNNVTTPSGLTYLRNMEFMA